MPQQGSFTNPHQKWPVFGTAWPESKAEKLDKSKTFCYEKIAIYVYS